MEIEDHVNGMVDEVSKEALYELNINNIIRVNLPEKTAKNFVKEELREEILNIKSYYKQQTPIIIDRAKGNISEKEYLEKMLETDYFYQNSINNNSKEDLVKFYIKMSNGISLVINSDDDFWDIIRYQHNNGVEVLDMFYSRGDIYEKHSNSFQAKLELGLPLNLTFDYTSEAIRAFKEAENKVLERRKEQKL